MHRYSEIEIDFIKNNYINMSIEEMSKILNIEFDSILNKIKKLKLVKNIRHYWTNDEILLLQEKYSNTSNKTLERLLLVSQQQIRDKSDELGLKKNKDCLYSCDIDNFLFNFGKEYENNEYAPLCIELEKHDWNISAMSVNRHFGGYKNLCKMFGLKINITTFDKKIPTYYSKNKDICCSKGELIITNYLIDNNIIYLKEYPYSNLTNKPNLQLKIADWYINNEILVEYFGMKRNKHYDIKMKNKIDLCHENNISLIEIYQEDLLNLDKIFYKYVNHQNP